MNDLGWAKKLALILFILTIWYAVLIDAPISIQNFVANLSATSHLYEKELVENYQIPWHKIGKDILFVAALTSIFVYSVRSKNLATKNFHKSILWAYSTLIFVIGILIVASVISNNFWFGIIGARAHYSLFAFIFGISITKKKISNILVWLYPVIAIQAIFVILQLWLMDSPRTVGTFHNPNTLGIFIVTFQIALFVVDMHWGKRLILWAVSIFLVISTGSRSAIGLSILLVLVFLWVNLDNPKTRVLVLGISVAFLPILPKLVELISGRSNAFQNLIGEGARLNLTWEYVNTISANLLLFGIGLGKGTTLLPLVGDAVNAAVVPHHDQLIGNELIQGGLVLLIPILLFFASPIIRTRHSFLSMALPIVTLGAAISLPLLEAWPANILLFALYGFICCDKTLRKSKVEIRN